MSNLEYYKLISPVTGEQIQVAPSDFENEMNWELAGMACITLGEGWRLPTEQELRLILIELHRKGLGNFEDHIYWSSTEDSENPDEARYVLFSNGFANSDTKDWEHFVRAVRSV